MAPSRIDHRLVAGSTSVLEFILRKNGVVFDITNDVVEMVISKGQGRSSHLKIVSAATAHADNVNSKVHMSVATPVIRTPETWWYEIWRVEPSGKSSLHVVGELHIIPTVKV